MKTLWSSIQDAAWRLLDVVEPRRIPARIPAPSSDWPGAATPSARRHAGNAPHWSPEGPAHAWKRRSLDRFAHHRRA